jgi:hypothetical protein
MPSNILNRTNETTLFMNSLSSKYRFTVADPAAAPR